MKLQLSRIFVISYGERFPHKESAAVVLVISFNSSCVSGRASIWNLCCGIGAFGSWARKVILTCQPKSVCMGGVHIGHFLTREKREMSMFGSNTLMVPRLGKHKPTPAMFFKSGAR